MTNDSLNVFLPTFGKRPKVIVGRDKEIADFLDALKGQPGHPHRATFFIGQRGMGKTALLLELAVRAKSMGFVVARVTASENMLSEIIEEIQHQGAKYVKDTRQKIKGVNAGALGFAFGLTFSEATEKQYGFRVKLSMLCEKLAKHGKGILFLIDEMQTSSAVMREFATTYQQLVGDDCNVAVAMAGLPYAVLSVLNDNLLTFLNRAHKVHLSSLPLNEVSIFYAKVFAEANVKIGAKDLEVAVSATKGYPYLMQLIGYYIAQANCGRKVISNEQVVTAITNARRNLEEDLFAPVMRLLSEKDKLFLKAMAVDKTLSKVSDIKQRLKVSSAYIQPYRRRLMAADIIVSPSRGQLEFRIPYLGEYLRGEL
ncbi:MAG: AAA family ATPase [Coriobacteriales bacterium]|jgi:hypothetical protein|nr:AAA family ATPase [Coriobacteriales bacterium]